MQGRTIPHNLGARAREQLLLLIDSSMPTTGPDSRLRDLREAGVPVHSALLSLLAQLEMSEDEALRHWQALESHRESLTRSLGRDPGLRVATLDYFLNRERFLLRPTLVEDSLLERAQHSSTTDGLTGLSSFRHFHSALTRELQRARRRSLDFSIVLLDLDDFGRVNERLGRPAGDSILREAAGLLQGRLRGIDIAARVRGGRFALLLPHTARLGAYVAADRIRAAVLERFLQDSPVRRRLGLTLSGGVSTYPADALTPEQLLDRATRALGEARQRGGNWIVLFHDEKRESVRFRPAGRSLRVRAFRDGKQRAQVLKARDLSGSGALFEAAEPYEPGEELEIRMPEVKPGPDLALKARVIRQAKVGAEAEEPSYRVGVRFLLDRPDRRGALEEYLAGLRRQGIEEGEP